MIRDKDRTLYLLPWLSAAVVSAAVVTLAAFSGRAPTLPDPLPEEQSNPAIQRVSYRPLADTIQPAELIAIRGFAAPQPTVRVLLSDIVQDGALKVISASGLLITDPESHRLVAQVPGNLAYAISLSPDGRALSGVNGKDLPSPRIRIQAIAPDTPMDTGGRSFLGALEVRLGESGLDVVNEVSQEDYIVGVVAGEAARSFPLEALKAQAVAARTYALSQLGNRGPDVDVVDTVADQVFTGAGVAWPEVHEAVEATANRILTHRGKPIIAYFSADCGGATRSRSAAGLGADLPYLRAVKDVDPEGHDYCAASPTHTWSQAIPAEQVLERLNTERTLNLTEVTDIRFTRLAGDGRVSRVTVSGLAPPDVKEQVAQAAAPAAPAAAPGEAEPLPGGAEREADIPLPASEEPEAADPPEAEPKPEAAPAPADAPEPAPPAPRSITDSLSAWEFRSILGVGILRSQRMAVSRLADGSWLFQGRGYGHGVGLCQWGACGRAQAGQTWEAIVKHYYPGAALQSAPTRAGTLVGLAKDTNGAPYTHAVVTLVGAGRRVLTDAAGRFRFDDVPAGTWDIAIAPPDAPAILSFAWRVREGTTTTAVIKPARV